MRHSCAVAENVRLMYRKGRRISMNSVLLHMKTHAVLERSKGSSASERIKYRRKWRECEASITARSPISKRCQYDGKSSRTMLATFINEDMMWLIRDLLTKIISLYHERIFLLWDHGSICEDSVHLGRAYAKSRNLGVRWKSQIARRWLSNKNAANISISMLWGREIVQKRLCTFPGVERRPTELRIALANFSNWFKDAFYNTWRAPSS